MLLAGKNRTRGLPHTTDSIRPILKAYALAYLTSTVPRFPSLIRKIFDAKLTIEERRTALRDFLRGAIGVNRFPTACALIVGGSTTLPRLLSNIIERLQQSFPNSTARFILGILRERATLICAFLSAWLAFGLLNKDEGWVRKRAKSRATQAQMHSFFDSPNQHYAPAPSYHMHYAGKTIDFTLFAVCRALDVLVITTWIRTIGMRLHPGRIAPRLSTLAQRLADPGLFATAAAIIMWSWFYAPERLPKQYNQWISQVAGIDQRLINALRMCRRGELVYGSPETQDADLPSLCQELDLPQIWGDPSKTVPIPCELYHCGAGKSCEAHAGKRFLRTFRLAMRIYLPLQLIGLFRQSSLSRQRVTNFLKDAARSSSFLAAFVGLFYYSVCLARTRLGPVLISKKKVTPQMWDSGLCVLAGCLACGWSIMLEKAGRRQEIAFFVAPRALATVLPRVYDKRHQRREQVTFAASVAIVMSAMQNQRHHVRGVFGKILESVLR